MAFQTWILVTTCLPLVFASSYPPPEVEFPSHEALLEAAFDAIKFLHAQMDDDHSGSVDLAESRDFIQEELSQVIFSCFYHDEHLFLP